MQISDNKYIVEVNLGKTARTLGTAAALGFGIGGMAIGGAKLAGVGRFASQSTPIVTQQQPIQTGSNQNIAPAKAKEEIKQEPNKDTFEFHNENVKKLYGALVSAEHRGNVEDPYQYDPNLAIRTKAGGGTSSAYGPLQITRNTARGYMDKNDPYHVAFVNQGTKFLTANTKDPIHGLGGKGTLSGEEYHDDYQKMAQNIMFGKAKELKIDITKPLDQKQLDTFVQHWRHGKGSGKQPETWYTDTTRNYYFNK